MAALLAVAVGALAGAGYLIFLLMYHCIILWQGCDCIPTSAILGLGGKDIQSRPAQRLPFNSHHQVADKLYNGLCPCDILPLQACTSADTLGKWGNIGWLLGCLMLDTILPYANILVVVCNKNCAHSPALSCCSCCPYPSLKILHL